MVLWRLWLILIVVVGGACRAETGPRFARDVLATPVVRVPIELAEGESVELEAVALQGPGLPVLHLWEPATARELVHAGCRLCRHSARVHYRNQSAASRHIELLVRSDRPNAGGQVDLLRNGKSLLRAASFGGALVDLTGGAELTYIVAATPGAPAAASLWGLDANGGIVAHADGAGPAGLPRLAGSAAIIKLLLAPQASASGRFNLYANDAEDRDGDGVGRRLERALGLCDRAADQACRSSPLAQFYRAVATATHDTDRDGLSDADELFGVPGAGLDLPRYGADARHKDVFIEVDHHSQLPNPGLSEQELSEIAALFAVGSAGDLKNPDGQPGLRLHFDVGFAPTAPTHAGLFGDWGGSGRAQAPEYRAARKQDFSPTRERYFRYAFMTRRGRGQAKRDAFTVNRDLDRINIFAHELGHTLGLEHYGHKSWGKRNCKPNYYSIMNYLYQYRTEIGFSRGATDPLNPASVRERGAIRRPQEAVMLREPPLELDVFGRDVDWNRDGLISDATVQASLLWSTYKSCAASESGLTTLASQDIAAATPVLLATRQQLLAFWLDETGLLWVRSRERLDASASWSTQTQVPGLVQIRHIAGVASADEHVVLAYVSRDETLHVATLTVPEGVLPLSGTPEPSLLSSALIAGAVTRNAPAIAQFEIAPAIYGAERALGVLYLSSTGGRFEQAFAVAPEVTTRTGAHVLEGHFERRTALDSAGNEIRGLHGPGLVVLPSGERCAVFPDMQSSIRFYCYDVASDRWLDLSAQAFDVGWGPSTGDATGLAYHRYRDASGAPVSDDPTRGALYLAFSEPESSSALFANNPHFYISEWLSATHGAREQVSFRWRGRLINEWTQVATGTGIALHDSGEHLQALLVQRNSDGAPRLDYLPHADGELDEVLGSGSDFQVMERGTCMGIRSEVECGDAHTGWL